MTDHAAKRIADTLDALDMSDPEPAHQQADAILLSAAPREVRDAYLRAQARADWWAFA